MHIFIQAGVHGREPCGVQRWWQRGSDIKNVYGASSVLPAYLPLSETNFGIHVMGAKCCEVQQFQCA